MEMWDKTFILLSFLAKYTSHLRYCWNKYKINICNCKKQFQLYFDMVCEYIYFCAKWFCGAKRRRKFWNWKSLLEMRCSLGMHFEKRNECSFSTRTVFEREIVIANTSRYLARAQIPWRLSWAQGWYTLVHAWLTMAHRAWLTMAHRTSLTMAGFQFWKCCFYLLIQMHRNMHRISQICI